MKLRARVKVNPAKKQTQKKLCCCLALSCIYMEGCAGDRVYFDILSRQRVDENYFLDFLFQAHPPVHLHWWRNCHVHGVSGSSGPEKPWCLVRKLVMVHTNMWVNPCSLLPPRCLLVNIGAGVEDDCVRVNKLVVDFDFWLTFCLEIFQTNVFLVAAGIARTIQSPGTRWLLLISTRCATHPLSNKNYSF